MAHATMSALEPPGRAFEGARRRRWSLWTLVVPLVLWTCVYVVGTIISSSSWRLTDDAPGHGLAHRARAAPPARWHVTVRGDTWRSVARAAGIPVARLHLLNPHDTARGAVVPGERLLLRR